MKCVICKNGDTEPGKVTATLEHEGITLVVKGAPARVCANCGEEYIEDDVAAQLLRTLDDAVRSGVEVEIRQYIAA